VEGKVVKIKTSQPVPYHIDGEPCGQNNSFNIKLSPASLSVLIPNGRRQAKV
jgi:diacylglycerol kinase (ATP)